MMREGRTLDSLLQNFEKAPQSLINVRLDSRADRKALMEAEAVQQAVTAVEAELGEEGGRVLLRPSGTEPLIRVMVEAQPAFDAHALATRIADAIEAARAA